MIPAPMIHTAKKMVLRVMVVAAMAASGCGLGGETVVPYELVGTWKTTAPAYADHVLRLSTTAVVFETETKSGPSHPVWRVTKESEHGTVLYAINYTDSIDQVFSFYYDPAGGGTIRLKNQPQFQWKRES